MTDDEKAIVARWVQECGMAERLRDPAVRARIRLMFEGPAARRLGLPTPPQSIAPEPLDGVEEDREPMACHNCGATLEQCIADPPCCRTTPGKQGCLHGGDPIEQNEESTNND
jgi:hypothetical protein